MTNPEHSADYVAWWQWRKRRACPHPRRRCIHGDEIIAAGYKRSRCMRCGKLFDDLPAICSVTGETHYGKPRVRHSDGCFDATKED
jgi:hypothetical protein